MPVRARADCFLATTNFEDYFGETPKPTRETRALPLNFAEYDARVNSAESK
jgi:hypothetical protein